MPEERIIEGISKNSNAPFAESNNRARKRALDSQRMDSKPLPFATSVNQLFKTVGLKFKGWAFKGLDDLTAHFNRISVK
jgi:hypothetical protein